MRTFSFPHPHVVQPFVVSIADIEHAHFERVLFSAKNFDLVLIFKEGSREKVGSGAGRGRATEPRECGGNWGVVDCQ